MNKLERTQRRASNFILKTNEDYKTRKEKLSLLPLGDRRFLFHVLIFFFFFIVVNGHINVHISSFIEFYSCFKRYPLRGRDDLTLKRNYVRTDIFKYSFFNRIVDMWNEASQTH